MNSTQQGIQFSVPLTTATGKVRVKRRENSFGMPIATSTEELTDKDYFEWQISYFVWLDAIWDIFRTSRKTWIERTREVLTFKPKELIRDFGTLSVYTKKAEFIRALNALLVKHGEIVVKKPHKNNREFVSNELADLFRDAWKRGIINEKDIQMLQTFNTGPESVDIEASYMVKSEHLERTISEGFECHLIHSPLFIKKIDNLSFVEIAVKHKQRAVGFQSMVYFGLYLPAAVDENGKSPIGRTAEKGEHVFVNITKEHLIWVAKAFIIASESHSWDMKKILDVISKE